MTCLVWLGRAGLLLNLVGALVILWGGTPPVYRPRYGVIAPTGYDPKKEQQEWDKKAAMWGRRNRVGLDLLIVGFALQLIGSWASR